MNASNKSKPKDDKEAYVSFPQHRKWFNKLELSERLGYICGPSGVDPSDSEEYIIRPIYTLCGMGVGAHVTHIESGDLSKVPPGYFWCEYFYGNQYSVTYEYKDGWIPINCWKAHKEKNNLSRFTKWVRDFHYPILPQFFDELQDVGLINVEFIEDKIIEVHLRASPDPSYNILIPVWADDKKPLDSYVELGYTFIESFDDADGFLEIPRIGFMVK